MGSNPQSTTSLEFSRSGASKPGNASDVPLIRQSVRRTPRWKSSAAALPEVEWSPQPVMVPGI